MNVLLNTNYYLIGICCSRRVQKQYINIIIEIHKSTIVDAFETGVSVAIRLGYTLKECFIQKTRGTARGNQS